MTKKGTSKVKSIKRENAKAEAKKEVASEQLYRIKIIHYTDGSSAMEKHNDLSPLETIGLLETEKKFMTNTLLNGFVTAQK